MVKRASLELTLYFACYNTSCLKEHINQKAKKEKGNMAFSLE